MNGRVKERRGKTLWMKERKEGYKERFGSGKKSEVRKRKEKGGK